MTVAWVHLYRMCTWPEMYARVCLLYVSQWFLPGFNWRENSVYYLGKGWMDTYSSLERALNVMYLRSVFGWSIWMISPQVPWCYLFNVFSCAADSKCPFGSQEVVLKIKRQNLRIVMRTFFSLSLVEHVNTVYNGLPQHC